MKTVLPFLLILLTATFTGCNKTKLFHLHYATTFTIPATTATVFPFSLTSPAITTNSTAVFSANQTNSNRIRSVYPEELNLSLDTTNGQTFRFAHSVQVYISTISTAEVLIAELDSVPANSGGLLTLNLKKTDVQHYIKDDQFRLRFRIISDTAVPQDIPITVNSNFLVDAKPIRKK